MNNMETLVFFMLISHSIFAFILIFCFDEDNVYKTILYKIVMVYSLICALFFWGMIRGII